MAFSRTEDSVFGTRSPQIRRSLFRPFTERFADRAVRVIRVQKVSFVNLS
jgi:hypothetical protein